MNVDHSNQRRLGVASAVAAYFLWGVLPAYWKLIQVVPAPEILAHRFIWSFVFMIIVLGITNRIKSFCLEVRHLACSPKKVIMLVLAAILIAVNWGTYIWAVNDDRVVEASLGYYINPLVSVMLGILVLKERLTLWQTVSFLLASVGVLNMTFHLGVIPWAALILAVSFALYGLAKKVLNISALTSITIETFIITPFALAYVWQTVRQGAGHFDFSLTLSSALLIGAGVVTAVPLILFTTGATRLPLTVLGFLQYLAPTISLALGVFIYHEPFTTIHAASFSCIWLALTIFSLPKTGYFVKTETRLKKFFTPKKRPNSG